MAQKQDNILDVTQFSFEGDFNKQINEILESIRLSREQVESLDCFMADLRRSLSRLWPDYQVHPFGSIITGLGIKTSDIDLYIELYGPSAEHPILMVRNVMRRQPYKFTDMVAILNAKVPILKLQHVPTQFYCDINFTSQAGVMNSHLLGVMMQMDDRVLQLAVILKYWSKVHKLTGTNLLSNYSLTLMLIFYLQVLGILPSVQAMQRTMPVFIVDHWNSAFHKDYRNTTDNESSVYELIGGFFNYYKNFDFQNNIISPYLGRWISKALFKDINSMPHAFRLYTQNVLRQVCKPFQFNNTVCIQDPFEHCRNTSVAVFERLFDKIKAHIDQSAKAYNEGAEGYFLKAILTACVEVAPRPPPAPRPPEAPKQPLSTRNKVTKNKNKQNKRKIKNYFRNLYMGNRNNNRQRN